MAIVMGLAAVEPDNAPPDNDVLLDAALAPAAVQVKACWFRWWARFRRSRRVRWASAAALSRASGFPDARA